MTKTFDRNFGLLAVLAIASGLAVLLPAMTALAAALLAVITSLV